MKYNIGDKVWIASLLYKKQQTICPHCLGKKYLTVIMGDESRVTIECAGCQSGFDPPRGFVNYYGFEPEVKQITIEGMDTTPYQTEYKYNCSKFSYNTVQEKDLFPNKELADQKVNQLIEEKNKEEMDKLHSKEQKHHTWSWNATYHRNQIKTLERDLEYHRTKLNYAIQVMEK